MNKMKSVQRIFISGDKWLYFKIYTGVKTADRIIAKDMSAVMNKIAEKELVDKWFFIRYNDPDFHLRLRILVKDTMYIGEIIHLFSQQFQNLIKTNEVWKIQLDTYSRELERYYIFLIEEAESIFYIDSECVLSIIKSLNKFQDENYRWMIALKMIDSFLSAFSLNIEKKQELLKNMSNSFKQEFGFNKYNSKQFNAKFRHNRKTIESVLNKTINDSNFQSLILPLKKKSRKLKPIISLINKKTKLSKAVIDINSLLSSYIHMSMNRLFRSKNRLHELIIYDFMYRYYTSEIARRKNIKKE